MANLVPSLSPDVFNQGAVRVNSDAFTNYIINTQARERAKADAFQKYLAEQGNNINEKGVRSVDLPDILNAKNAWQQHSIAHKRELMNPSLDGGRAYADNQKLYNEAKSLIPQSIDAAKNNAELESILKNPKLAARLNMDVVHPQIDASRKSIKNGFTPFNTEGIYNRQPWTNIDENRLSNNVSKYGTLMPIGDAVPISGGKQTTTYERQFQPVELANIASEGLNEYKNHTGYQDMIDNMVKDKDAHAEQYKAYNDIYKKYYGKDIEHPEELAIAYAMGKHTKLADQKTEPIPVHHRTDQERLDYLEKSLQLRNRYKTPKTTKSGKEPDTATPIENDFNSLVNNAKSTKPLEYTPANGATEKEYELSVPPEVLQKFTITDPVSKKKIVPTHVRVSEDEKSFRPIYPSGGTSSTGNIPAIHELSTKRPIGELKDVYGGVKFGKTQVLKEKKIKKNNDPLGIF